MIDWHSHILPGVDDGSRDVAQSLALLQMLADQGVTTVAATPHFYADRESAAEFLARRDTAMDRLRQAMPQDGLKILCGAEVRYYSGISRLENLRSLCLAGTDLLLLEMPGSKWTDYTMRELAALAGQSRLTIILAHVERYMGLQDPAMWGRLLESGILMQCNAGFFTGLGTKRRALALLQSGQIHLLGSDCHNLTSRPPCIGKAAGVIRRKLGEDFLRQMDAFGEYLLDKSNGQPI